MISEIFMVLFFCGLIAAVCIGCEKVIHPMFDLAECTRRFKTDFGRVMSVLFSSNSERHVFDASLWENFLTILNEYIHAAFPPNYKVDFYDSTPRFCIAFVPNRELTAEELNRLVKLLCLKFSQYLQLYGLCWRMFGEYHVLDGTIHIFLYYAEFSADCQPFFKRYRIAVKHKSNASHGVLHDEALDKELNHVQNKP